MKCKKCGNELADKAVVCPNCGCKTKTSILKKWWFWVVIVVLVIIISVASGGNENTSNTDESINANNGTSVPAVSQSTETTEAEKTAEYEKIELQTMIDDLKSNALKAEKTYNNKNVEITGNITSFDSSGDYISIEAVNADEFNFDYIQCFVKNDDQLNFLLEKSVGDTVTIKGKITSVGEILGYSLNIDEVQ